MDDLIKGVSETMYWVRWSFPIEEDWPIIVGLVLILILFIVTIFWRK